MKSPFILLAVGLGLATAASAATETTLHQVSTQGIGDAIGTITLEDSDQGLKLTPNLKGLTPGAHGFHVHQNPSCEPGKKDGKPGAALAAGGHYDPEHTGKHEGPQGHGHEGDLPVLMVKADGTATDAVVAPHLHLADVVGHSLMIHVGGDNYSDTPEKLGGGGARFACGVVK